MRLDRTSSVLLVVDMQLDFMPGGALAVQDGDRLVEPVADLMRSGAFGHCVATQDWHPAGHVSFASSHPGRTPFETVELFGHPQVLWPDHCVRGTAGAELHPGLPTATLDAIIRKGTDPAVDSYSAFRNNHDRDGRRPSSGLAGFLRDRGVREVWVCGLARDFCCKWSAEDAAEAGFRTGLVWDLTRAVDPVNDARVREQLGRGGIEIVRSDELPL